MKVITLVGPSNSGKTTVLKDLIINLEKAGATVLPPTAGTWGDRLITPKKLNGGTVEQYMHTAQVDDYTVLLEYQSKKIGITTVGDKVSDIMNQFHKVCACDIFICAAHENFNIHTHIAYSGVSVSSYVEVSSVRCESTDSSLMQHVCKYANDCVLQAIQKHI